MEPATLSNKNRFDPILLAPFIFIGHFIEELPGFVSWFNSHAAQGITSQSFWRVNLAGLVITVVVVAFERFSRSALSLSVAVAWLSFLMLANGLLHVAGAFVDRGYVPGLITAAAFYLPYFAWFFLRAVKSNRVSVVVLIVAAIIGAIPMVMHGYLILFKGSRLF